MQLYIYIVAKKEFSWDDISIGVNIAIGVYIPVYDFYHQPSLHITMYRYYVISINWTYSVFMMELKPLVLRLTTLVFLIRWGINTMQNVFHSLVLQVKQKSMRICLGQPDYYNSNANPY